MNFLYMYMSLGELQPTVLDLAVRELRMATGADARKSLRGLLKPQVEPCSIFRTQHEIGHFLQRRIFTMFPVTSLNPLFFLTLGLPGTGSCKALLVFNMRTYQNQKDGFGSQWSVRI